MANIENQKNESQTTEIDPGLEKLTEQTQAFGNLIALTNLIGENKVKEILSK